MTGAPRALLAIADAGLLGDRLAQKVAAAARGGVEWVLLRAKGVEPRRVEELAHEVAGAAPGLLLSVHGDADMARRAGCFGVHFPSNEIAACSGVTGPLCVGASCHGGEEIRQAHECGAAYGFLSPVFSPLSKADDRETLGVEGFSRIASATDLPLYALGGLKPEHAGPLAGAGAAGVAVLGDLFMADDVEARAALWVEAVLTAFGRN